MPAPERPPPPPERLATQSRRIFNSVIGDGLLTALDGITDLDAHERLDLEVCELVLNPMPGLPAAYGSWSEDESSIQIHVFLPDTWLHDTRRAMAPGPRGLVAGWLILRYIEWDANRPTRVWALRSVPVELQPDGEPYRWGFAPSPATITWPTPDTPQLTWDEPDPLADVTAMHADGYAFLHTWPMHMGA